MQPSVPIADPTGKEPGLIGLARHRTPLLLAAQVIAGLGILVPLVADQTWAIIVQTEPGMVIAVIILTLTVSGANRNDSRVEGALLLVLLAALAAFQPLRLPLEATVIVGLLMMTLALRRRHPDIALFTVAATAALLCLDLVIQTYGVSFERRQLSTGTLAALVLITLACVTLLADRPKVRALFLSSIIGRRTRLMIMVAFGIPWVCGMILYHAIGVPERSTPVEAIMFAVIIFGISGVAITSGYLQEEADAKRRAAERRLKTLAISDGLTGLLNRAGLTRRLGFQWDRFQRSGHATAVLILDVDHFKSVNDTHGHDVGDAVLSRLGAQVAPCLRRGDALGRWGGEEFLVLLADANPGHVAQVAERLRRAIMNMRVPLPEGEVLTITASFGVSRFCAGDRSYAAAIKRADENLYEAKESGRNRVVIDADMGRARGAQSGHAEVLG